MVEIKECPKCGTKKHHEVIKTQADGKESTLFRCRSCGHIEYTFPDYDPIREECTVEMMGDAFREFLAEKENKKEKKEKN